MRLEKFKRLVMAACFLMVPALSNAATTVPSGNISITGTVDQFAEWASVTAITAADFDGHINAVNQTRTAHTDLSLYSNINVTLAATTTSGTPDFDGILTDASANTLTTRYKISGSAVVGAAGFLAPAAFFNPTNTYALTHAAGVGSYTVTLTVTMASPAASAPDAGNYSCGLALTATW